MEMTDAMPSMALQLTRRYRNWERMRELRKSIGVFGVLKLDSCSLVTWCASVFVTCANSCIKWILKLGSKTLGVLFDAGFDLMTWMCDSGVTTTSQPFNQLAS